MFVPLKPFLRKVPPIGWVTLAVLTLSACGGGTTKPVGSSGGGGGGSNPDYAACVTENQADAADNLAAGDVVIGANLYDNWYETLGLTTAPSKDHALWSEALTNNPSNPAEGAETWRCVTCHGWDYAGADGAFGQQGKNNAMYTGFPGILTAGLANSLTPEKVFCAIKVGNDTTKSKHNFSAQLTDKNVQDRNIWDLTAFIISIDGSGAVDTASYIAANGGAYGATAAAGQTSYTGEGCSTSNCHDVDGTKAGRKLADEPLGVLASEDPWEMLHKIRFGDAADLNMPAFYEALSINDVLNVIAYAQESLGGDGQIAPSVPSGGSSGGGSSGGGSSGGGSSGGGSSGGITPRDLAHGGRLYDNSFAETSTTPTTQVNPLYTELVVGGTATAEDSWRCKTCHGWDYKGGEGDAGGATGAPPIFGNRFAMQAEVDGVDMAVASAFDYLKRGWRKGTEYRHAFGVQTNGQPYTAGSPALADSHLRALAEFVVTGIIDTDPYVLNGAGQKRAAGSYDLGRNLYNAPTPTGGGCADATCHGPDGNKLNFATPPEVEYVGTVAMENPWEALHKIRFGDPHGPQMPSTLVNNLTVQDAVNILTYAQTLLTQ
jgi:mono/diheme cytochrome c family protein